MAKKSIKQISSGKVFYTLRPRKEGRPAFSDVKLPDGTVIRRVDESVHKRALSNAARAYKEKA
jgi:hypothetical protein